MKIAGCAMFRTTSVQRRKTSNIATAAPTLRMGNPIPASATSAGRLAVSAAIERAAAGAIPNRRKD